jgi:predicted anti-sigma-YlaC factor YlaD
MQCGDARIEISARLDGESSPSALGALDRHVRSCPACRAYAAETAAVHRSVRLRAAEPVPRDLTAGVLAAIGDDVHQPRVASLRIGLAVVGLIQILVALPALLLGDDADLPAHTARHLGAFAVALGIGLLVAAWQPRRVGGLLALTGTLVACLVLGSVIDVIAGDANAGSEIGGHATEIVGLGLLWMLARDTGQVGSLLGRHRSGHHAHP